MISLLKSLIAPPGSDNTRSNRNAMPQREGNTDLPGCARTPETGENRRGAGFVPSRRDIALLALALVLTAIVGIAAGGKKTVTIDEFHHLPAGCLILRTGEFFMHPKSPPLARCWSALPAMLKGAKVPTEDVWRELAPGWGPWMYGTAFWLRNRTDYDALFWWGRVANLVWLLPLGFSLFYWASDLYGRRAAWLTTLLLCTAPSLLAHAPLVTTDFAAASTWLTATYFTWRAATHRRHRWIAGTAAGLALGIGMLSKFSLILLPGAWLAIHAFTATRQILQVQRRNEGTGKVELADEVREVGRRFAAGWILPVLVALVVVNAGYGFRSSFRPLTDSPCQSLVLKRLASSPLGAVPIPLPRAYVDGLDAQKADSDSAEFPAYLLGRWSSDGWWYYYPIVLLAKIPTGVLILLAWSLASLHRRTEQEKNSTWLWLLVPPTTLLVVLMFGNDLDLGVRYLLPCLPFAWLLAGRILAVTKPKSKGRKVLAAMVIWGCTSSLMACPDFLAYFSKITGGWRQGHKWVLDSNLDWGQDLGRLKQHMTENGISTLKLAYFGHVWPEHYGIEFTPLTGVPESGHIAASVSYVMGQSYAVTYTGAEIVSVPADQFGWLRQFEPVARIGRSIWLYDISEAEAQAARNRLDGAQTR